VGQFWRGIETSLIIGWSPGRQQSLAVLRIRFQMSRNSFRDLKKSPL
jgi:hypothetical protein